ncbi:hypothetical protein [Allocoleopsis sp.]|uniref:hypothetical protein n=1 Tax=Allocoleopsis sp. TaxID=3088169 RepID=UPI002FD4625F
MDTKSFTQERLLCIGNQGISWIARFVLGAIEIVAADYLAYRRLRKGRWYKVQNIHDPRCFEWVHESNLFHRGLEWDEEEIVSLDDHASK